MGNKQKNDNKLSCPLGNPDCTIDQHIASLGAEINSLKKLVITDSLTGLFNVGHLRYCISQEMERTRRQYSPTTFIMLDVDHFKKFNDSYGHVVGDEVLRHLANMIRSAIRQIDIPCRYGGEEFGIVLPSTPLLIGIQVAERIRKLVSVSSLNYDGQTLNITVSAGVNTFQANQGESLDSFIADTDKQLYRAKKSGRNRVCYEVEEPSKKGLVTADEKEALFGQFKDEK